MRDKVTPTKEFCNYGHRMLINRTHPRPNEGNIYWKKRRPWRDAPARWYAECRQCALDRQRDADRGGRRQQPSKSRRPW